MTFGHILYIYINIYNMGNCLSSSKPEEFDTQPQPVPLPDSYYNNSSSHCIDSVVGSVYSQQPSQMINISGQGVDAK